MLSQHRNASLLLNGIASDAAGHHFESVHFRLNIIIASLMVVKADKEKRTILEIDKLKFIGNNFSGSCEDMIMRGKDKLPGDFCF